MMITWDKVKEADGYQIQYMLTSKNNTQEDYKRFLEGKAVTINVNKKKTSAVLKNLKSDSTYFFRIRAYKMINHKKVYSAWTQRWCDAFWTPNKKGIHNTHYSELWGTKVGDVEKYKNTSTGKWSKYTYVGNDRYENKKGDYFYFVVWPNGNISYFALG